MTTMVTQLRSAIDNEERRLEKDLQSSIQKIVSETALAYQVVFSDITTALQSAGELVSNDLHTIESGLVKVVSTLESTAEAEYHFFSNSVEASITKIKGVASDISTEVGAATTYLRTGASADFDAAVSTARKDFDKAKTDFKTAITAISSDVVSKTKAGIASVVSSAQSDLNRLDRMKSAVIHDITSKVGEIGADLKSVKNRATADLERIVSFMRQELDKMERRVEKMEAKMNRVGMIVAGVAVAVAVASSIRLIQQAHEAKINRHAKKGSNTRQSDLRSASDMDYEDQPPDVGTHSTAFENPKSQSRISRRHM